MSSELNSPASSATVEGTAEDEEIKQFREAVAELNERIKLRSSLLEANLKAVRERAANDDDDRFAGRDASLKKNTAFVKKLRSFTEKQKDDLLKEAANLNLTRYVSEAAQAIAEAKLKMSDVSALLTLCSLLHREYAEFGGALLHEYAKVLQANATFSGASAGGANVTRLRVDVRMFAELLLVGVFAGGGEKEALATLSTVLTNCVTYAKSDVEQEGACAQAVAPALVNLLRYCGDELLSCVSQRQQTLAERLGVPLPRFTCRFQQPEGPLAARLAVINDALRAFHATLCDCVTHTARRVRTLERANARQLEIHGELSADKQTAVESARSLLTKVHANATVLSDLLHLEPPAVLDIEEELARQAAANSLGLLGSPNRPEAIASSGMDVLMENLFEDDDSKQFYTKLPDLRCLLPVSSKEQPKKDDKEDKDKDKDKGDEATPSVSIEELEREIEIEEQAQAASGDTEPPAESSNDAAETEPADNAETGKSEGSEKSESDKQAALAAASRTMRAQFDSFLETLPRCVNRDLIDRAAAEFLTCYNSKSNRRRLVATLFAAPRTRYDLLAFYGRMAALLNQCFPAEVGTPLSTQLSSELRWHVRKKDQTNIEAKLKTVRFIGELVKFGVFDPQDALKLISVLLADFTHHNVEMLCALLESAGRYLCRFAATRQRARVLMQVVQRKTDIKRATLDARYPPLIESAVAVALKDIDDDLAIASGVPRAATLREEVPVSLPVEFARHLLVVELANGRLNPERVLRCLRRLDWDDSELRRAVTKLFSDAICFKYPTLDRVACVLQGIASYYQDVAVAVVDNVVEDIRFGMQFPDPRLNQRRVTFARYFAELYNYRLIDSTVVFKVLYSLITFGVQFDERVRTGIPKDEATEEGDETKRTSESQQPIFYTDAMSLDPADHLLRIRLVCVILEACGTYFNQGKFAEKLDCFLLYFQRYCWYKRVHPVWNPSDESHFPNEYIFSYEELFTKLRPKWRHAASYEIACREVDKLEASLTEKVAAALKNAEQSAASGLNAIGEEENENENENDNENESETGEDGRGFESMRRAGAGDEQADSEEETASPSGSRNESDDELADYDALDEQDALRAFEEAAFANELDRAISESFQQRVNDSRNLQSSEIPVPVNVKDRDPVPKIDSHTPADSAVKFTVMLRKPAKQPQLVTVNIPAESQIASHYLKQEERERFEKEQLKRAVLGIHERQKAEEQFEEQRRTQNASDSDRLRRY